MAKILVNETILKDMLNAWLETMNDCVCCPCYFNCDQVDSKDDVDCTEQLINLLKQNDYP